MEIATSYKLLQHSKSQVNLALLNEGITLESQKLI